MMPERLSKEHVLDVLANSRRRQVIQELKSGPKTVGTLAESIARQEHDIPQNERVDGDTRKTVYIGLYQDHMKKLDDCGVVNWDKDRGDVEAGPNHCIALQVLEAVSKMEVRS